MAKIIEIGTICVKINGRLAGKKGIVSKVIDNKFVEIKFNNGKTKKCNIVHLIPVEK